MTEHIVAAIDRESPVPLYFQLASVLEEDIANGRLEPGSRLPSEPEMCEILGLSRTTIRQAFARLLQRGLVERRKGQGTFVMSTHPGLWLIQSSSGFFHDEVDRQSRAVTSQIVAAERRLLPDWACKLLKLPEGSSGACIERVRSLDGLVALYAVNYLPEWIADDALAIANENESLYRRLSSRAGVVAVGGQRSVDAVGAEPWLAAHLQLSDGAPVALIESVSWDNRGRLFDCYRAWLRTDRARIEVRVPGSPVEPDDNPD